MSPGFALRTCCSSGLKSYHIGTRCALKAAVIFAPNLQCKFAKSYSGVMVIII
jgi:hypothetical protein